MYIENCDRDERKVGIRAARQRHVQQVALDHFAIERRLCSNF